MTVIYTVSGKDPGTSSAGVTGGPGTLSYAIAQINASDPNGGPYVINITGNVTLSGPLSPILGSVTINGGGYTIDAGGATRIFFVGTDNATMTSAQGNPASTTSIISQRQQVTIENVTLKGGLAQGGSGAVGGGGGLGAGGALFVNQSADVTLSSVNFSGDKAIGGNSSGTANPRGGSGGGGGLGGSGSASGGGGGLFGNAAVAGGGLFGNAGGKGGGGFSGDGTGATGNAGNLSVYGLKGSGGSSGQPSTPTYTSTTYTSGGANGGGGADATPRNVPIGGGGGFGGGSYMNGSPGSGGFGGGGGGIQRGINGGNGGFGGGGGYAAYSGGNGGFGGGGGGGYNNNGGTGGFGGGGGANGPFKGGNGGFGAGGGGGVNGNFNGSPGFGASSAGGGIGGGGAGMGGAVFVASGGTLQIDGTSTETGSSATGGFSGDGRQASGLGAGIFFQGTPGGAPASLTFGAGNQTIASAITDQNGSGGSGASNGFGGTGGATALVKSGGGTLTLSSGASTYSGGTEIKGGTLDLTVSTTVVRQMVTMGPAGTGVISFHAAAGQTATLALDAAAQPASGGAFGYTLADFGSGDALDLKGFGASGTTNATYFQGTLLVQNAVPSGNVFTFTSKYFTLSNPEYTTFQTQSDGQGGTLVTAVVCFASGTLIRTVRGDVPVETLTIGDRAVTASGAARPIRWIGTRSFDCGAHPQPAMVRPVRIAAGAFGAGRPYRDLTLSPHHAVAVTCLDEVLIPIRLLVNGSSIVQDRDAGAVTYWHVELDDHDILLANGLPAESYIDVGNRCDFEGEPSLNLHPRFASDPLAAYCRPLVTGGGVLAAVRAQLAALVAEDAVASAAPFHLLVDGTPVAPVVKGDSAAFAVPAGARDIRLVSPAWSPRDADPSSADDRRLGLMIEALHVEDLFGTATAIALDDPGLAAGFHPPERNATGRWRWTDGDARIDLPHLPQAGPFVVRLSGRFAGPRIVAGIDRAPVAVAA